MMPTQPVLEMSDFVISFVDVPRGLSCTEVIGLKVCNGGV